MPQPPNMQLFAKLNLVYEINWVHIGEYTQYEHA